MVSPHELFARGLRVSSALRWHVGSGDDSILNWAIGLTVERHWRSGIVSLHSWHGCILPFTRIGQPLTVNYDLGHSRQMPCDVRSPISLRPSSLWQPNMRGSVTKVMCCVHSHP